MDELGTFITFFTEQQLWSTFTVVLSKPKGNQRCHQITCVVMKRVLWAFNSNTVGLVCNRKSGTTFTVLKMGPNFWESMDNFV